MKEKTLERREAARPPLRDSQEERACWLCPLCGAEQYRQDRGRLWRGRRICLSCFSRRKKKEETS